MENLFIEVAQIQPRTAQTVEQEVWLLAQPIEIDDLVGRGVLRRLAGWYEVAKLEKLPEHVLVKILAARTERGRLLIQLAHSSKASQRIAERIGTDWRRPKPP